MFELWVVLYILTRIQGGFLFYAEDQLDAVKEALVNFQQNNDTKAALEVYVTYTSGQVCAMTESLLVQTDSHRQLLAVVVFFYDAPTTPSGVFDDFLAIPTTKGNVSTTSYSSFIQSQAPLFATNGLRLVAQSAVRWIIG